MSVFGYPQEDFPDLQRMPEETPDNFSFVIPVDDTLHTEAAPFCPIASCPCHEDDGEIAHVAQHIQDGLLTPEEATDFVSGRKI